MDGDNDVKKTAALKEKNFLNSKHIISCNDICAVMDVPDVVLNNKLY